MAREKGVKQPIRDKQKIREMKEWLLRHKSYRDYFLFFMGLNLGLRISDILRLRVMDLRGKDTLTFITQKTKREVTIPLNAELQAEIKKYTEKMAGSDYLFQSREGENQPITQQMADKVLKEAATACNVENWGTHSMRKSFGYWYYQKNKDIYFLMRLFGHSSQHQTLTYIGITQEEIRDSLEGFVL